MNAFDIAQIRSKAPNSLAKVIYKHTYVAAEYVTIDNSETVGSIFDFERTDSFSVACRITPSNITGTNFPYFISKGSGNGRWFFSLEANGGLCYATFGFVDATGVVCALRTSPIANSINFILVASYSGNSSWTGITLDVYDGNGILSTRGSSTTTGANTGSASFSGSIKNTGKVFLGIRPDLNTVTRYAGEKGQYSIWNKALSNVEKDELAHLIAEKATEKHSAYNANCISLWKQWAPTYLHNAKNSSHHGTFNGFTAP